MKRKNNHSQRGERSPFVSLLEKVSVIIFYIDMGRKTVNRIHSKKESPVSGRSIPVLGVTLKRG